MKKLKKIMLVCDCIERFWFFKRVVSTSNTYNIVIITADPFVKLLCFLYKIENVYISPNYREGVNTEDVDIISNSLEVIVGGYDINYAQDVYASYFTRLSENKRDFSCDFFIIWNGQHLLGMSISAVFPDKCMFLELSNLPSKLFFDKRGVNAYSSIFKEHNIIDELSDVDDEVHTKWILDYENYKKNPPPQATVTKIDIAFRALNTLTTACTSIKGFRNLISRVTKIKPQPVNFNKVNLELVNLAERFVFCPLQVSSDTQLFLHSEYDNMQVIKKAFEISKQKKTKLFVKFHPAERDMEEVQKILLLRNELGFTLVNNNTNELLKKTEYVVVNNSTVGLEALIYMKEIHVIGRAVYSHFDQTRLKKYIHNYLIDGVDYFSHNLIDIDIFVSKKEKIK
jgi:capsular polysaccharide export protein